ncbi:MAG: type II toxin-antitoxin system PemK/MazF family toxin [Pseudomonadota bacterium]|nr:type II toxin-antitoxin system PemK/MazF family toxin [Pseudomonadota bacterium]
MMRRGEIWLARLNPNVGAEAGKVRPVVVMLDDDLLATGMSPVVCIPLTSKLFRGMEGLRIAITPRDKLLKPCFVMPEQTRALDLNRFGDGPLASLTAQEMIEVERSLMGVFGLFHQLNPSH